MKKILSTTLFFFAFSCNFMNKNDDNTPFFDEKTHMQFVEGSEDIPLAKGLEKLEDESLNFDSPAGNVISVSYESDEKLGDVKDFYIKTLPQMGWKIVKIQKPQSIDKLDFVRDNERLEIEFASGKKDLVKFYAELGI